jgi:hypothetical protein
MVHPFVSRLLELCPGAVSAWQEHLASWGENPERGTYNDLAVFAHHVVDASQRGDFACTDRVFGFIEGALATPTQEVEGLLVWGLVEDIQTISSHTSGLQQTLSQRLGPKSLDAWRRIAAAWRGGRSLADVLRAEARDKTS